MKILSASPSHSSTPQDSTPASPLPTPAKAGAQRASRLGKKEPALARHRALGPRFRGGGIMVAIAAFLMTACTLAPQHVQPAFPSASEWAALPGYQTPAGEQAARDMAWEKFFANPALTKLIETALANNGDLKTAALNVEQARLLYRVGRSDLLPRVNAATNATMQETSDNSDSTGRATVSRLFAANVGFSGYEADLFGRIRSANDAAEKTVLATQAEHESARNALIAETANAAIQLLADRKLLNLTEKTLDAQQRTYDLLQKSREKGVGTEQDVSRAAIAAETARVALHQYRRFVERDKNALDLLTAVPGAADAALKDVTLDDIKFPETITPGLPSEVLLARPDIRAAEYALMSRNADIGAARAAFFPNIMLTGNFGYASSSLGGLFGGSGFGAWSFIPQVTLPLFNAGRNRALLDLALLRREQAVVDYEQAIRRAFREVADELAARATLQEQVKSQKRLVAAATRVHTAVKARFKAGIDSSLSTLDAQRTLYAAQQDEIRAEQQRLSNLVTLYRVLGGGKSMAEIAPAEAATSAPQAQATQPAPAKTPRDCGDWCGLNH